MIARKANSQIYQFWMCCKCSAALVDLAWSQVEKDTSVRQKIV